MTAEIRELEKKLETAKLKESAETLRAAISYVSQAEHIDWHYTYQERASMSFGMWGVLTEEMQQGLSIERSCPICFKEVLGYKPDTETEFTFEELIQEVKDFEIHDSTKGSIEDCMRGVWQFRGELLLEKLGEAVYDETSRMSLDEIEDVFGIEIDINFAN